MEKTLIVALFALACAAFVLFGLAAALLFAWWRVRQLPVLFRATLERISALEIWTQEADAQAAQAEQEEAQAAESEKMRQLAYKSQAVQAERKEEAAMVEAQGRAILGGPGTDEEKKNLLLDLVRQYPQSYLGPAQKLNRSFGISKFLGMKEADLFEMLAGVAKAAMSKAAQGQAASSSSSSGDFGGQYKGPIG